MEGLVIVAIIHLYEQLMQEPDAQVSLMKVFLITQMQRILIEGLAQRSHSYTLNPFLQLRVQCPAYRNLQTSGYESSPQSFPPHRRPRLLIKSSALIGRVTRGGADARGGAVSHGDRK